MQSVRPERLLEPFGDVVLGPEKIYGQSHPAGKKHQSAADDFTHEPDGLLDDVYDCQYRQYDTYDVNNSSHNRAKIAKN